MQKIKQIIAACDRRGNILGAIERWEAHKKGILHRAISVAIKYKGKYILQHRKHPSFDGVFDLTSSSHQLKKNGKFQNSINCAYETLKREWNLKKKNIVSLKHQGWIYYKVRDPKSKFMEHEFDEILIAKVSNLPLPNFDFAYGYSLVTKKELLDKNSRIYSLLAPWVKVAIKENLL